MSFLLAKSIHVVGFISWLAGLFYLVRLFVYFEEARQRAPGQAKILTEQLALMQGRLWKIITRPAMVVTVLAGSWTIYTRYGFSGMPAWLHVKLGFLVLLLIYHFKCGRIVAMHAQGKSCGWGSGKLRLFNELSTMLMVGIVALAVYKSSLSAVWGVLAWISFGVLLMIAVRMYRRARERAERNSQPGSQTESTTRVEGS